MPASKNKYPANWKQLAFSIKSAQGWICEGCDRPCKKPDESWDQLKYRLARRSKKLYNECCEAKVRFVLTTAHLDHNTQNNAASNLKALCSVCHLRYDAQHHAKNAAKTRAAKTKKPKTKKKVCKLDRPK